MTYTITVWKNSEATVSLPGFGYCERFYGHSHRADAIRYIKRIGGPSAKFIFQTSDA